MMRAVVVDRYGPPEVLRLEDVGLEVPRHAGEERRRAAARRGRRRRCGRSPYTKQDILLLKELVETGSYRAVVDQTFRLEDVVEATRYVETGQKTGNVVLTV